ncbi:proteasome subunit alpha [Halostagnicola larsenii XH-48]|uniref:Proteasome subunit alpha n=1 Tax=Halostagnicola larsenii XH-48 TaxID=797299 RepID=W0JRP0_9EURY|nr:archaeal proteasome endopeptidase complex subunit alpha [Halostagnicola larsenii]AHF99956.1 proteasome subunit alpha [Halostagnicola larsenii XH-48]
MDSNAHQQAYDRGSTIFSPDGRLYQVEYAREAVERGSPSVGVLTKDGVVLAARKRLRSPLLEPDSVEKVHRVDDHIAVATAGHAADGRMLVEFARNAGQRHRLRYGEPIGVEPLAKEIADHVQESTHSGGSRPYGSALLVAGIDEGPTARGGTRPRLYEVDPGGTSSGWQAAAIGDGSQDIRAILEDKLLGGGAVDSASQGGRHRGTVTALEALETTAESALEPAELTVLTIDSEPTRIDRLSADEIESALAETTA